EGHHGGEAHPGSDSEGRCRPTRSRSPADMLPPLTYQSPVASEDRARWLVGAELPIDHVPPPLDLGIADGESPHRDAGRGMLQSRRYSDPLAQMSAHHLDGLGSVAEAESPVHRADTRAAGMENPRTKEVCHAH